MLKILVYNFTPHKSDFDVSTTDAAGFRAQDVGLFIAIRKRKRRRVKISLQDVGIGSSWMEDFGLRTLRVCVLGIKV